MPLLCLYTLFRSVVFHRVWRLSCYKQQLVATACLHQPGQKCCIFNTCILKENYCLIITAPPTEVAALRKEVKQLMELVESLISEFQAVEVELEASRLDVDCIRSLCEVVASQHSNNINASAVVGNT